jgi:hypothetical protein
MVGEFRVRFKYKMTAAGIDDGRLLRSISKDGIVGKSLGDWAIWSVVEQSAREIGIERYGSVADSGQIAAYKSAAFIVRPERK